MADKKPYSRQPGESREGAPRSGSNVDRERVMSALSIILTRRYGVRIYVGGTT